MSVSSTTGIALELVSKILWCSVEETHGDHPADSVLDVCLQSVFVLKICVPFTKKLDECPW